jgi:hypothetical protein
MAASVIIGLISAGMTTLTGGTLLGGFLIGGAGTFFTHFLVTTAMGAALNALTPKPSFSAGQQGYSLRGESGAALDHQVIYGEARVGGARVYDSATGDSNQYLHRVLAFAGHEVDSYQEIYLNDEVVTVDAVTFLVTSPEQYAGKVRIKQYIGTSGQAADPSLIADTASLALDEGRWTADHKLSGIAYLYVRFEYDANAFPNGVPSVSAKIRGKKVFNPVTSTTAWSDNPALCIRDYLTSDYGLNQPAGRIDDTLVAIAVGVCNQTVESESRYTCNGAFRTGAAPSDILTNLLTSMGGLLWYGQGKWRMKAAAWSAPTVSFDEDDLRSAISLSTRHSRRDNFNSVKGVFAGDDTDWQPTDYPEVTDPAFLVADNNVPNVLDFPLPFTSSSLTAQRVARIALNRNREQLTFSASFGMRAFQVQVGDFINITNTRFGWTNKAFEVVEWTFGLTDGLDIQINMTLREISEGVFTGADGSVFEQNNTTLPNPSGGLTINNLTASGGGSTQGDGTFINSVILDWDSVSSAFLDYYEVEWKVTTDSIYSATTTEQSGIEIVPVVDGLLYEFRVRAVTVAGIKGDYATVQFTGGGDQTAPGLPTSITATGGFQYITIRWTNPADADLNYVEVYEADSNNSGAATKIGISGGDEFVRTNLGLEVTKWYFLKAVDYSGNASGFTAGVNATTTFIDDEDFANGIYSLFTDQGLYAIEDVTSLPVAGDFVGQKVFNRTDGKLYQWTGSAWELVVAQVNAPDINGQLQTAQIAVDAVTNALIANNAVQAENIANLAVTSDKIASLAITETKIASDAITTPKIAANAVTASEIAAGSITTAKIAAGAVTATEIAAGSIIADKIAAGAVTAVKIAADSITSDKIAANSITSDKIVAGTIQANDIATNTITATQIAGNTITGDKIVANTITGGLLATSGIITNSAQINDAVIVNAKIQNAAVDTLKVAGESVTVARFNGPNSGTGSGGTRTVASLSWTPSYNGQALVLSSLLYGVDTPSDTDGTFYLELLYNGVALPGTNLLLSTNDVSNIRQSQNYLIGLTAGVPASLVLRLREADNINSFNWSSAWIAALERFR